MAEAQLWGQRRKESKAVSKTSRQRADGGTTSDVLARQHCDKAMASRLVSEFARDYAYDPTMRKILGVIAQQKAQHVEWLMAPRGLEPALEGTEERYWRHTLPEARSLETRCAVAAHAVTMRFERMRAIVGDADCPPDVRHVFEMMLKDELFHERTFRELAGPNAMLSTAEAHVRGCAALDLNA